MKYLLLLFLVLIIGCSQQEAPLTSEYNITENQGSSLYKPPAYPGNSNIERLLVAWPFMGYDPDRQLIAFHMDLQAVLDWVCCEDCDLDFPIWNIQDVYHPQQMEYLVNTLLTGDDISVVIFGWDFWENSDDCDYLAENWLYLGTHKYMNIDNNTFGVAATRTNTWGWMAQGIVYDQDGNKYHYHEQQRAVFNADPFKFKWVTENIRVHPFGN